VAVFALFFFSVFEWVCSSFSGDFVGLGFAFGDGLEEAVPAAASRSDAGVAFATSIFLEAAFGIGFGVICGFGVEVGAAFGGGVAVGVRFGVDDGNSISLFAVASRGCSLLASSVLCKPASGEGEDFSEDGSLVLGSVAALASATSPSQRILCARGEFLASTLQRINPAMSVTWASAISVTFRQKRQFFDIYFGPAVVAMPTFVICACFSASISAINFCTDNSRSERITTANSGLVCFN